jgi:cell division protein FtsZ
MASAQLETNPFIAPPPVETKAAPQPRMAPDPFAEAAVTNGGPAPRRASPSLLERMTGLGRKAKDDRQPAPAESAPEARTPGPEPLRVQTPAAEAPAQAQAEAQAPRAAPEAHRSPEAGPAPEPSPAPRMPPAPEPQPPELASSPVTAPPAKPAPTLNVNAEDRMVRGASEDELLEIPAFLRRQAN